MKITAMPSPTGRNDSRMFIFHCPKGQDPRGALDAAMKHGRDEERDLKLREAMEKLITNYCPEDTVQDAFAMLDECLPGTGKTYGDRHADDEEDDPEGQGRAKMRAFLESKGASAEDIAEFDEMLDVMPHNAQEGKMGGRLSDDRRRGARDKRKAPAMDEKRVADFGKALGLDRIKQAV